ncbi:hypothetical protein [Burkholderia pseudomallei]|uniref:hypothetical protein n=1 Tax=Burkholderia pseudomallei TaxID=28450 RepID=UPI001C7F8205
MKGHRREAHEERSRQAINLCSAAGPATKLPTIRTCPVWGVRHPQAYALDGATALRDKPGGGEGNRGRALTEQREVDIRALLRGQMPDQLKMSFALWTRHAVRE